MHKYTTLKNIIRAFQINCYFYVTLKNASGILILAFGKFAPSLQFFFAGTRRRGDIFSQELLRISGSPEMPNWHFIGMTVDEPCVEVDSVVKKGANRWSQISRKRVVL
jgi:hypothetical protein